MAGGIFINKAGDDPFGIVPPEECGQLRDQIARELTELRGPNDEPLHTVIIRKEDGYKGKYAGVAPDLMYVLDDYHFTQRANLGGGKVWGPPPTSGWHSRFGTFIACGPDIIQGVKLKDVSIYDVTPTILHLMGQPVPSDMDGRVLKEIFKPGSDPAGRDVGIQTPQASKTSLRERIEQLKMTGRLHPGTQG